MNFTFEPKTHTYRLDGKRMTGVTTILGVLNKPALVPWAARMAVEYVKEHSMLVSDQNKVTDDIKEYQTSETVLEDAKTAYAKKRDEGAEKGTNTHALVEEYIKLMILDQAGKALEMNDDPTHYWTPIKPFIDWARAQNIKFLASEEQMYSEEMFVAGTADFIFEKDGKTYIGDIKTFKKIWDRTPFYQCAGYGLMHREMHGTDIEGYVIFNLPKERGHDPEEDVLWSFDTEGDTKAFLACVEIYRQNANFTKSYKSKK